LFADASEEDPQVVVYFGDGADRGARIAAFCSMEMEGDKPRIMS
jgi:hypothetical protein